MTTIKCNYLKKYISPFVYRLYVDKKIKEINSEFNTKDVLASFIFITDIHWGANAKQSPWLVKKILQKTSVNKVIFGGDYITSSESNKNKAIKYGLKVLNKFKFSKNDLFCNFGNHDDNSYMQDFNNEILCDEEISKVLFNKTTAEVKYCTPFTYYFDSEKEHIRYLFINTGKRNLSEKEFSFVATALSTTLENYKVIVLGHIWVEWNGTTHVPNDETGRLIEMFNAYNNRKKYGKYDFYNVKGTILLIGGGHIHNDRVIYTDSCIPIITTNSDAWEKACGKDLIERFTPSEQCFDIFLIENEQIKIIRVGHGCDRNVKIM